MKYAYLSLFLGIWCCACNPDSANRNLVIKQKAIDQKEQELLKKEQVLLLKERELIAKEEDLEIRKRSQDSLASRKDTLLNGHDSLFNILDTMKFNQPDIAGRWNVNMRCIETDCAGSAVGDEKNEQWQISYHNRSILAQAFTGDSLVREYTGTNANSTIELLATPSTAETKMVVKLQDVQAGKMRGQREIIRPENCHIVYAIELKKLQP